MSKQSGRTAGVYRYTMDKQFSCTGGVYRCTMSKQSGRTGGVYWYTMSKHPPEYRPHSSLTCRNSRESKALPSPSSAVTRSAAVTAATSVENSPPGYWYQGLALANTKCEYIREYRMKNCRFIRWSFALTPPNTADIPA